MKRQKERCVQIGDRIICTESEKVIDLPKMPMNIRARHLILIGAAILGLAFLTGLGMDIWALVFFLGGIALTVVGVVLTVLAFSYRVWIGIVLLIGVGIGIYFLWLYVVIPNWYILGSSMVTAFENFMDIIIPP